MRTLVIANPTAGQGRVRRLWPTLRARLQAMGTSFSVQWTATPGEATALTRSALRNGIERIIMVGGDGTFHEVVNGFFAADGTALAPDARLVPVPCGTGNDFCRSLSPSPAPPSGPLFHPNRVQTVDLLRITYTTPDGTSRRRYGLNMASFGLGGSVIQTINQGGLPLIGRSVRYLSALLYTLASHHPHSVELLLDGTPLPPSRIRLVAVGNGHSFGCGIKIAPNAILDDGRLDVTVIHDRSLLPLLCRLPHFYRGTHPRLDGVSTHQGKRLAARPHTDTPIWLEADGELLGQLPATIEVIPDRLRLQY